MVFSVNFLCPKEIAQLKEELAILRQRWEEEKKLLENLKAKKGKLEQLRFQEEEADRAADYNKVAELRYSAIPSLQEEIHAAATELEKHAGRLLQEEVDEQIGRASCRERVSSPV